MSATYESLHNAQATTAFVKCPESVARVRAYVRTILDEWGLTELTDTAMLLASELASNAVIHASCDEPFSVHVHHHHDAEAGAALWIDVCDSDPRLPHVVESSSDELHGRGLWLVDELADEWGAFAEPSGKRIRIILKTG